MKHCQAQGIICRNMPRLQGNPFAVTAFAARTKKSQLRSLGHLSSFNLSFSALVLPSATGIATDPVLCSALAPPVRQSLTEAEAEAEAEASVVEIVVAVSARCSRPQQGYQDRVDNSNPRADTPQRWRLEPP